jgi:hypothetical protein
MRLAGTFSFASNSRSLSVPGGPLIAASIINSGGKLHNRYAPTAIPDKEAGREICRIFTAEPNGYGCR